MEIDTQALTTCEVAADGGAVSLGFVDSDGKPATIRLSLNQVGALAMTLPGLIDKALQTRFGDQSLRYAYPLASWAVEASSDPRAGSRVNSARRWWRSRWRYRRCARIRAFSLESSPLPRASWFETRIVAKF